MTQAEQHHHAKLNGIGSDWAGAVRARRPPRCLRTRLECAIAVWLLLAAPALSQPIPGGEGWRLTPRPGQGAAPPKVSQLDIDLIRCYRRAIATGQFFLGDVSFVLARCQQPYAAWVAGCENREGKGAAICWLGPEQAVGDALRDAWAHRDNLAGWLASLPSLPKAANGQN